MDETEYLMQGANGERLKQSIEQLRKQPMNLDRYQDEAKVTADFDTPDYPFVCLGEETGEVLGKLAKYMRRHRVNLSTAIAHIRTGANIEAIDLRNYIIKELGDLLWEVSMCADAIDVRLSLVADRNIAKLRDRQARGVIDGAGDDR